MTRKFPTSAEPTIDNGIVLIPVPKAILAAAAPEWVSETTCESVFGLDALRFARACKTKKITDARKDGQLWLAPVAAVRAYLLALPTKGRQGRPAGAQSADTDGDDFDAMPLPPGARRT